MQGRIIKQISNDYTVLCGETTYICKARGLFRKQNITPLVGDFVSIDPENVYILDILPRKNALIRPPSANVDQTFLITSVRNPDFSTNLLDKLLVIIEYNAIQPIIIFTKMDLLEESQQQKMKDIISYYKNMGYTCFENTETQDIQKLFKDKVSVFTGQSGAGKSTLLNQLDIKLHIKTDEISHALGRGKHTTRHTELLPIMGGLVADTPGFSSISLEDMDKKSIRDNFADFNIYRDECKYADCLHDKEDHCIIKEKVIEGSILKSRYENYIKFIHDPSVSKGL